MAGSAPRVVESNKWRLTLGEYIDVANHHMPESLELEVFGFDEPDFHVRIELRDNVPRIASVAWRAGPGSREVMQKDLAAGISAWVEVLYASLVIVVDHGDRMVRVNTDPDSDFQRAVRNFLEERRTGKRRITGDFLRQVAAVYRQNIDHAPTEAVSRTFGVKHRQATDYVKQARDRGFLPPTKQGRAQA